MDENFVTEEPKQISEFDAIYRTHASSLKRVAFLLTGSNAAAEDAVHEVFLRCADRLDDLDHPLSYLRAAVVNECRKQHRRRQREQSAEPPPEAEQLPYETIETLEALSDLSARKRTAVVLRYFVDIPDTEIAEILRCRPSTVRSLIRRALIDLRADLE